MLVIMVNTAKGATAMFSADALVQKLSKALIKRTPLRAASDQ